MQVVTLIDKAAKIVGSRYKLAQKLGVSANRVNDWYHRRIPCSPADMARISDAAGLDAQSAVETLVESTIEQHEGTPRGEQLKVIFSVWLNDHQAENRIGFESTFDNLMIKRGLMKASEGPAGQVQGSLPFAGA